MTAEAFLGMTSAAARQVRKVYLDSLNGALHAVKGALQATKGALQATKSTMNFDPVTRPESLTFLPPASVSIACVCSLLSSKDIGLFGITPPGS